MSGTSFALALRVRIARKHERWRIVALVRALAIVAAAFVIGHGSVPAPRTAIHQGAIASIVVASRTAKAEPTRGQVVFHDHSAPDAQPAVALPEVPLRIDGAALSSIEPAPPPVRAPRLFVAELLPVARGPPSRA